MLLKFGLANHWISEIWTHCSHGSKQNSHQRRSVKKATLKNFTIFTGNACVGVLQVLWRFFRPAIWKKRLEIFQYRCFSLNIEKFFKILILKNICKRLLLSKSSYNHITNIIYMLPIKLFLQTFQQLDLKMTAVSKITLFGLCYPILMRKADPNRVGGKNVLVRCVNQ